MVEGLDAILVLHEDWGLDFYCPRWKDEYSLSVGIRDDLDEAFDSRNSGFRDF